jgi:mRNA interferase YafQ
MKLRRHRTFIKEFKKARLADAQFEKFIKFANILIKEEWLPTESKDHSLLGEYQDCREFHIGGDMLIIYLANSKADETILLRIGTHSQLFK